MTVGKEACEMSSEVIFISITIIVSLIFFNLLDNIISKHKYDYIIVLVGAIIVIPIIMLLLAVSRQPWVYDLEACERYKENRMSSYLKCEEKILAERNRLSDMEWLREFREKEEMSDPKKKCIR
jgi:hypothetical protein